MVIREAIENPIIYITDETDIAVTRWKSVTILIISDKIEKKTKIYYAPFSLYLYLTDHTSLIKNDREGIQFIKLVLKTYIYRGKTTIEEANKEFETNSDIYFEADPKDSKLKELLDIDKIDYRIISRILSRQIIKQKE